jgi:ABC-type phosphate/phosphonate transport system permease subunit
MALSPPKVILPMLITIVIAAVAVVVAAIIVAPIIALVVGAVILLVGARSPTNIFLDLLVSLVSVCPLLCHREQVLY